MERSEEKSGSEDVTMVDVEASGAAAAEASREPLRAIDVDLPVRRQLLDAQFQGYKLSLEELPSVRVATLSGALGNEAGVLRAQELTSLQHFRAFAVINALTIDPWPSAASASSFAVYYFNEQRQLISHFLPSHLSAQVALPESAAGQVVGHFPDHVHSPSPDAIPLTPSLQFADALHCVLTDGRGRLFVHTGPRGPATAPWQWEPLVDYACPENCLLLTARTVPLHDAVHIHLVLLYVGKQAAGPSTTRFVTVVEWVVLRHTGSTWTTSRVRRLEGTSAPHYIAVEPAGSGLSIAAEGVFKIVYDSDRPLSDTTTPGDAVTPERPGEHAGLGQRGSPGVLLAAPDDVPGSFGPDDLEDCDAFADETCSAGWMRFDAATETLTHRADLSGRQFLFNTLLDPQQMPAMCIRYDVDGLVYQPMQPSSGTRVPWEHVATFNALGYVMASKQEKKFAVCSSALSFACLCDGNRNVYLYRNEVPLEGESVLKNRKTGQTVKHVARQHVLTLTDADRPILGLVASERALVILKKDALTAVYL